jgi:uroporphyrinogen decarboxylase
MGSQRETDQPEGARRRAPEGMSHRERIETTLAGGRADRLPVSFWHHFPGRDHTPELLAESTVSFYRRFDVDFVKLMPTGMYAVVDYGVAIRPSDDEIGTTVYVSGPIGGPGDWATLPRVSPDRGMLAQQVEAVRLVRARLGPDVPIVQTIFSPLSMASKLAGGTLDTAFLATDGPAGPVLERLADDVIAFGDACLNAGADGFYFASQLANRDMPTATYERLGVPYDLRVLDALRSRSWLLMLHLHGVEPRLELADRYPVDIVSWEDRETSPSLSEALRLTSRCLMAGLSRGDLFVSGTGAGIAAEVQDAVAQTGGQHLILAPGCVLRTTSDERLLRTIVPAVPAPGDAGR